MGEKCNPQGRNEKAHKILIGKRGEKKRPGRPSPIWKRNIKMDHTEIGSEGVDWIRIRLAQDRN
jgi:hypothetical protein